MGSSTDELLKNYLQDTLPDIVAVDSVATKLVSEEALAEIFDIPPKVRLMQLGTQAAPIVGISGEVWVNVDVDLGKNIVNEICNRNEGHLGLWIACLIHTPGYVNNIAPILKKAPDSPVRLGLVKRQYLRGLVK